MLPIQPLIAPLFDGRNVLEELARLTKFETSSPYEIVRRTFRRISGTADAGFEALWRKFLHEGTSSAGAYPVDHPALKWDASARAVLATKPGPVRSRRSSLELVLERDAKLDDGRFANNGWLQELSNPITKLSWGNAALFSPRTARELGINDSDVVRLELDGRNLEIPAMVLPGQADYSVSLALGYGEPPADISVRTWVTMLTCCRTSRAPDIALGLKVARTGTADTPCMHPAPFHHGRTGHHPRVFA